ncbi:L10-interacting MYB domain-containing protein-like [Macadamia integrifolia]|uniref:L10-interacting MYB domain-containing protein-like n=1 Tax=Macadamia integrifolia TaxID=60698 RepID=UPI001C4EF473|nr:L10-interacting MYB domain-containing protein-like [Macadamia integrifolia]
MANNQVAVNWTQAEADEFVKLMIDNIKKGNKTNSTFIKSSWTDIKERLELVVSQTFTRERLQNKMNKMHTDYRNFKKLLETTGFGWNPITKTATTDDKVWENALQENPEWVKFKRNGLPHWPELQMIFGDSYACGDRETNRDEKDFGETQMNQDPQTPLKTNLDDIEEDLEVTKPSKRRLDRTPTRLRKKSSTTDVNRVMTNLDKFCSWRMELGVNPEITSAR